MNVLNRSNELARQIVAAICQAIGGSPAVLHEPSFNGNEWRYVKECLDSSFVSSVGRFVDRFERDLEEFTGAKHAVAVVNGTAALHIAMILAGVRASDEVLVPALSFVASANAILYCNATPHFVDGDERTLGVDAEKLREYLLNHTEQRASQCINRKTGRVIRALVPMHTFGHPADLEGLLAIARDFNLIIVEDAAESLGSLYYGHHTGTFGLLGTLSFNGNKTITTGGGGAILTNRTDLAQRAKHLTTTAKLPHPWEYRHDELGYNYRMPNINAALGCAQLEQLPTMLRAKKKLTAKYSDAFESYREFRLFKEPIGCSSNYWLQTLVLAVNSADARDLVLTETNRAGFGARPAWITLNCLPQFQNAPQMDLSCATLLSRRLINIPSSAALSE